MAKRSARQEAAKRVSRKPKLGTGTRFRQLAAELKAKGFRDPEAGAAAIGRKKFGKRRFQEMATEGRRRAAKSRSR